MRSIEALSAAAPGFTVLIKSAVAHLEPVELFGRLPERNELLGRESSEEEVQYLKDNPTACATPPPSFLRPLALTRQGCGRRRTSDCALQGAASRGGLSQAVRKDSDARRDPAAAGGGGALGQSDDGRSLGPAAEH